MILRPYEFWHPRVFEAPYYAYLAATCARHRLSPRDLPKANWALDHGELGLGSKYSTQMAFDQARFLPTRRLDPSMTPIERRDAARAFAGQNGFPLIWKPDNGAVGKGILKIAAEPALLRLADAIRTPHLLQTFTPKPEEFGVFFVRHRGRNAITGVNRKHFPTVVGNGKDSIGTLASQHYRFTPHWNLFLKYLDTARVPAAGEQVRLSFIGSHTMGCKFTDDTGLLTRELERAVFTVCDSQSGFNFGRLDVKADDEAAFRRGEFVVIEVNGIASLPTHMFDPEKSLAEAYRIFLKHGRLLVEIANEHRGREMEIKPVREIWRLTKENHRALNATHEAALRQSGT